jgi:hypothetical protein
MEVYRHKIISFSGVNAVPQDQIQIQIQILLEIVNLALGQVMADPLAFRDDMSVKLTAVDLFDRG